MTEPQLTLVDVPAQTPPLTERQQLVMDAVAATGRDGLHADEAGALLCDRRGTHPASERCAWCGKTGNDILKTLRSKGLVRYSSKLKAWLATDLPPDERLPRGMTDRIPF